MRFQAILLVLFLAAGTFLYLLNQGIILEEKTVQMPGGNTLTLPLTGAILAVSAGVMLLMLLAGAVTESLFGASRRRLHDRVLLREREIADMKGKAHDDAVQQLESLRQEIGTKLDTLTRVVEERNREVVGSSFSR